MNQKNKKSIDDQLADYTDNILNEKTTEGDENPITLDPELRALEQTALRLKNAFQDDGPSQEVLQRMRKNIHVQWQRQENKQQKPFWKKWIPVRKQWRSQHARRIQVMVTFSAIIVGLLLTSTLLFNGVHSEQPAASGHNLGVGFLVAALGTISAIWFLRRK